MVTPWFMMLYFLNHLKYRRKNTVKWKSTWKVCDIKFPRALMLWEGRCRRNAWFHPTHVSVYVLTVVEVTVAFTESIYAGCQWRHRPIRQFWHSVTQTRRLESSQVISKPNDCRCPQTPRKPVIQFITINVAAVRRGSILTNNSKFVFF